MSDLISRSALVEELKREERECEDCMIMPSWYSALGIVKNAPTVEAIPKEKLDEIVEQLKNISVMIYGEFNVLGLERAIEIVKEVGGVCEQKTQ